MENMNPTPPMISPRTMWPPLSEATKVMPRIVSMKNSGEPNRSTMGRRKGTEAARMRAPKTARYTVYGTTCSWYSSCSAKS